MSSVPGTFSIGTLARATGTKVETVRYYEQAGLLAAPARTEGNYRAYTRAHLDRLGFVRRARGLGFSLDEVRELLRLSDQPEQPCEEVDRIARGHLEAVERKMADLAALVLQPEFTRAWHRAQPSVPMSAAGALLVSAAPR